MKGKFLLIGFEVVLLAIGISVFFYLQLEKEKSKIESLEQKIESLSVEKVTILKKIKETKEEKKSLSDQLQVYGDKLQRLESDITKTQKEKDKLVAELSSKESLVVELNGRLNSVVEQESELKAELGNARSKYQKIAKSIEDTKREKLAFEEELKKRISRPKGVELKRIVVKVAPGLEGKIIEVSREYNFSIINMGLKDGTKSGDMLGIYRNDSLIAKAVVENVYEDMSSIIVFDEYSGVRILVGDIVRIITS
ncbi:MAG: hypothetical protein HQ572_03720 [Candidatus Omnitrophica bacterium]|nr:hypothetical protein [Candidatus Omnitrophota bacterium]